MVLHLEHGSVRVILNRHEVQEQVVFHGKDSVCLEVWVVSGIELCCHSKVIIVRDHHVDVCWTLSVTSHHPKHLGRRSGSVNRVFCGLEAVEVEPSGGVGAELSSEVVFALVLGVVGIVFAVRAGLPHVEDGVWDSRAGVDVSDGAVEVRKLAV